MAATGASHRCCCRRHAGSHKEKVGLRQLNEEVGLRQLNEEVGLQQLNEEVGLRQLNEEVGFERVVEPGDCSATGWSLWELPWQRLGQVIVAAVAGMPAPTRRMWGCGKPEEM